MSLPPALRAGLEAVEPPGGVALVACSGGVDSVSLAAAAVALGRWRVRLAYVDHGLQRRAGAQARCVRALGAALGCGVDLLMADPRRVRGGGGLEDGARQARYACLAATAARRGAAVILTAHTADDQAETVLMRLASGAGSRGLAGIPARRGPYARPWLGVSKAEIIAFAVARGLAWVEDPSNADERHARNRLRARRGALDEALGPAWARG
ncbi:tRNA lysidine(34) synthetase TilS, partial [Myxococcota bacterium]|nr:tRNA lysidine(34) synthetase TilS [Myxococcota bacterium]